MDSRCGLLLQKEIVFFTFPETEQAIVTIQPIVLKWRKKKPKNGYKVGDCVRVAKPGAR